MKDQYNIGERIKYKNIELEVYPETSVTVCAECYFLEKVNGQILCNKKNLKGCLNGVIFKEVNKMKKPIFENEEEAELFLQNVFAGPIELHDIFIETFKNIKRKGYIKQSKLEAAKKEYRENIFYHGSSNEVRYYVEQLEKEIGRNK